MIENKNRNAQENAAIEVAEDNRELDWKSKSFMAQIFMGSVDVDMAYPFPFQDPADKAIGDEWCAKVQAYCEAHIDGAQIDRDEEIPAHVFHGLAELGLFAIKIPTEYNGLGLSQTNYQRILALISTHCGSVAATLSAHQSIGVPQPLKLFGTKEQKQKYLPKFREGWVSAFALTEPGVGSDPAAMSTTAERTEDGKHWILNGEKLWCTNGVIADVLVVMCRTPDRVIKGKARKQISAFIVEADSPGIELLHRCKFMGIRAIENGLIKFTDVKVPAENLLWGEGKGLRLALTTLNDGRLGIPAICATAGQEVADFSARWAKSRVQWGKAVGMHEAGSDKLARVTGGAYAMESLASYCASVSDRGDTDIRMEAAAAKMYNSELGFELLDLALQLRGGRGFETAESLEARGETAFPFERALRDSRINRIVEGTTDVMHLFLARESLDKHLKLAGPLLNPKTPLGDKLKAFVKCAGFYSTWYPGLWLGGIFKSYGKFDDRLAGQMRWIDGQTRKLARTLFHKMVLRGPKLEMEQLTLARIVEIGTELAVMALVASRAQTELDQGDKSQIGKAVYWLDQGRLRVQTRFTALKHNSDKAARKLATELIEAAELLPEYQTPDLPPMERERGRDLTSGRQERRMSKGGRPAAMSAK